ncbi:hypothetical protein ZEAMMB73_Zm00001d029927 [Zea mays]|uniref:Uncharacterized protein n=1 Tax=Zea mays TaxID=4577 RepID=A0A1D6K8K7_MAIZE|nr:hypothetical protein ZEAMMB73_Zm00001d029927 [Zea mays]
MATGQLFSKTTQALFYNYKQLPIQQMLDLDFLCVLKLSTVHTQQLMYLSTLHPSEEMLSRREKATNFKPDYDIDIHMKVLAMSVQESGILTGYKMKC